MLLINCLLILFFSHFSYISSGNIVLDTSIGRLEAKTISLDEKIFKLYSGLRYAEAPIRQNRFQKPIKSKLSKQISPQPNCIQFGFYFRNKTGNVFEMEDCLFISVLVPHEVNNSYPIVPVVVIIKANSFNTDVNSEMELLHSAAAMFDSRIVVLPNYRLGPLGFFTTGDGHAAGNWAAEDIKEALSWITRNIGEFGGDAKDISLIGYGSGAALASYVSLDTTSSDAIRNLVLIDGSILSSFAHRDPAEAFDNANKFAGEIQCEGPSSDHITDCLRTVSVEELKDAFSSFIIHPGQIHKLLEFGYGFPLSVSGAELADKLQNSRIPTLFITTDKADRARNPIRYILNELNGTTIDYLIPYIGTNFTFDLFRNSIKVVIRESQYGKSHSRSLRKDITEHFLNDIDKNNNAEVWTQFVEFLVSFVLDAPVLAEVNHRLQNGYANNLQLNGCDANSWQKLTNTKSCEHVRNIIGSFLNRNLKIPAQMEHGGHLTVDVNGKFGRQNFGDFWTKRFTEMLNSHRQNDEL